MHYAVYVGVTHYFESVEAIMFRHELMCMTIYDVGAFESCKVFIHSFILRIFIYSVLTENYSKALPTPARLKRNFVSSVDRMNRR